MTTELWRHFTPCIHIILYTKLQVQQIPVAAVFITTVTVIYSLHTLAALPRVTPPSTSIKWESAFGWVNKWWWWLWIVAAYSQTQCLHQMAWLEIQWRHLALNLHSSNEPGWTIVMASTNMDICIMMMTTIIIITIITQTETRKPQRLKKFKLP